MPETIDGGSYDDQDEPPATIEQTAMINIQLSPDEARDVLAKLANEMEDYQDDDRWIGTCPPLNRAALRLYKTAKPALASQTTLMTKWIAILTDPANASALVGVRPVRGDRH